MDDAGYDHKLERLQFIAVIRSVEACFAPADINPLVRARKHPQHRTVIQPFDGFFTTSWYKQQTRG